MLRQPYYSSRPRSPGERKAALFDSLLGEVERRHGFGGHKVPNDIGEWATSLPVMLDGRPFTFRHHEYLVEPYSDNHPYQVEMKATQLGQSPKPSSECSMRRATAT
ncbi:MAG: hypothetical protein AB9873_18365 [Syntrophobacteraceae bacterium]